MIGPTCHRAVIGAVRAALADLVKSNLAALVDPAAFAGCFAAKRIAPGEPVSRHAWGVALDINYRGNQNQLIAEALGVCPAFEKLAGMPGTTFISNEPALTFAVAPET